MTLIGVRDLRVDFGTTHAVRGVSFDIPEEATLALVGESGSGKSVTALSILGLLPPTAKVGGDIIYEGRNILKSSKGELRAIRGAGISMIFQEPMSSLNPVFSVGFQIAEALREHRDMPRPAALAETVRLLDEVKLADARARLGAYPFQLSGGEQQRVMIAMAIACEPKLLIADEPTSALDVTVQKQILDLIAELQRRRRMAMLFITHDLGLVGEIAGRVLVMHQGVIREEGSVAEVFGAPRDAYTRTLLAARPRLDQPRRPSAQWDDTVVLEARGLEKRFDTVSAVKGASFKLRKGRTLGLVGESGSGKTTLGLLVARLHQASAGSALLHGRDTLSVPPRAFKRSVQVVFQNPYASLNPRFSIGQTLTEPMRIHGIGADERERRALAAGVLAKVGLPADSLLKYPHQFSGGQRQRIAIARALVLRPELLVCDEAVSALDVSIQAQILKLLQDLQDETAMSYLFISHDLAVVRSMADEVMVMKDGEIVESAPADEIYSQPRHPYTRALLASVPGYGK
ncbi:MAG TPA: ABC transporter ATP-binding protein [Burkholderiales bacterium]|nr:ABC transporter ATP-binding protein [Burkholderiales bacterium]